MEKAYTHRPVRAEQFLANSSPFPAGIAATGDPIVPYVFTDELGMRSPIRDGDYLKRTRTGRVVVPKADFEDQFQ